jgi:uncharacterized membrane protein YdjX (TVP38/TMEM64 family)
MNTQTENTSAGGKGRLLFAGLFLTAMLVAVWTLPLEAWLEAAASWIETHPWQGRVIFLAAFVVGACAMVPGSLLFMTGGFLFGFGWGVLLVGIATPVAATAAFLLGATVAREQVAGVAARYPRFDAIDRALDQKGALIVLLTRVSMLLPYNVLNYIFGVTRIKVMPYFVATAAGMLPPVVLFVYIGSAARNIDALMAGGGVEGPWRTALLVGGLVAIATAAVVIQRTASRVLRESIASAESADAPEAAPVQEPPVEPAA